MQQALLKLLWQMMRQSAQKIVAPVVDEEQMFPTLKGNAVFRTKIVHDAANAHSMRSSTRDEDDIAW